MNQNCDRHLCIFLWTRQTRIDYSVYLSWSKSLVTSNGPCHCFIPLSGLGGVYHDRLYCFWVFALVAGLPTYHELWCEGLFMHTQSWSYRGNLRRSLISQPVQTDSSLLPKSLYEHSNRRIVFDDRVKFIALFHARVLIIDLYMQHHPMTIFGLIVLGPSIAPLRH